VGTGDPERWTKKYLYLRNYQTERSRPSKPKNNIENKEWRSGFLKDIRKVSLLFWELIKEGVKKGARGINRGGKRRETRPCGAKRRREKRGKRGATEMI